MFNEQARQKLAESHGVEIRERQEPPRCARLSDVIVKNITMLSHACPATYNEVRAAVRALAEENGWSNVEAAAVIAQSYGLRVSFR